MVNPVTSPLSKRTLFTAETTHESYSSKAASETNEPCADELEPLPEYIAVRIKETQSECSKEPHTDLKTNMKKSLGFYKRFSGITNK